MYREITIPGYDRVRHFDEISSTMDGARQLLKEEGGASGWCGLVTASRQSAGRGRQGRTWLSGERAYMGTFIFCTDAPVAALSGYSLAVGVSVAAALSTARCQCMVKWPNDLVVVEGQGFRKLGGILIEVEELEDSRAVLIGLGVNLSQPPDEVAATAISLEEIWAASINPEPLRQAISHTLRSTHDRFIHSAGFSVFRDDWHARSAFAAGKTELVIEIGEDTLSGVYAGVSDSGALKLIVEGSERLVHSGHIVTVRL